MGAYVKVDRDVSTYEKCNKYSLTRCICISNFS